MNSRSLNESSANLSKTSKSTLKKNQSFSDNLNFEANYSNRSNYSNQDILSNDKYSELADEQKHYVKDLLKKLQAAKDERKLTEKNSKILEHRVVLLHNQEKIVIKNNEYFY